MELLRYAVVFAVGCGFGWFIGFIVTEVQAYIVCSYEANDNE